MKKILCTLSLLLILTARIPGTIQEVLMYNATTLTLSCVLTGCVCMIVGILIGSAGSPHRWQ